MCAQRCAARQSTQIPSAYPDCTERNQNAANGLRPKTLGCLGSALRRSQTPLSVAGPCSRRSALDAWPCRPTPRRPARVLLLDCVNNRLNPHGSSRPTKCASRTYAVRARTAVTCMVNSCLTSSGLMEDSGLNTPLTCRSWPVLLPQPSPLLPSFRPASHPKPESVWLARPPSISPGRVSALAPKCPHP